MTSMTSGVKTRKTVNCVVFGTPEELRESVLPTYEDVIKYFLWLRYDSQIKTVSEISSIIAKKLLGLWKIASIPAVSYNRIVQLFRHYHGKYRNILKPLKGRKKKQNYQEKIKQFQTNAKKLFDISACKCEEFNTCICEKSKKVPKSEQSFLKDQRTERKMIIGAVDITASKKNLVKEERKKKELHRNLKGSMEKTYTKPSQIVEVSPSQVLGHMSSEGSSPDIFKPSTSKRSRSSQMRVDLPSLALACERTGVSDRNAAIIASAVLEDIGMVSQADNSSVIDRHKVRRQRKKIRYDISKQEQDNVSPIQGLYFDGRKDKTLVLETKGDKSYRRTVPEEHYVLVQEPNSKYIGHITPQSGSAANIKSSIVAYLEDVGMNMADFVAVGCDGTVVNTGQKGGIVRQLEVHFERPLQWFICQLHANELPLRHLFQQLDGPTTGPRGYSGPIGKMLTDCEKLKIVNFIPIPGNLIPADESDLSTDQKYMLEICRAVVTGNCSKSLANQNPGKMGHSRWLTMANRLLRLYTATESPSENLKSLAEYVVKVYAPVWFQIKLNWSCVNGANNLLQLIQWSRYLSDDKKQIVDPIIQRNGYFGHPENVLLAMLCDERKAIRELALRRILKIRSQKETSGFIRHFQVPSLNFEASDYTNLIPWQDCQLSEPPLTMKYSEQELTLMINEGRINDEIPIEFPKFPCHTQMVERCVKLVTNASLAVCGQSSRDGYIRAKQESRRLMPRFETKAHYYSKK